jgi:hypothetical protein
MLKPTQPYRFDFPPHSQDLTRQLQVLNRQALHALVPTVDVNFDTIVRCFLYLRVC